MSTSINIGGDSNDQFYRYKRDQIELTFEARNGGQTKLSNIDKVCTQLHATKKLLVKYIQSQLATSTILNDTIRGNVKVERIEEIIVKYTEKTILCPSSTCRLPEWNGEKCSACGHPNKTNTRTIVFEGKDVIVQDQVKQVVITPSNMDESDINKMDSNEYEIIRIDKKYYVVCLYAYNDSDDLYGVLQAGHIKKPSSDEIKEYGKYKKIQSDTNKLLHNLYDFRDSVKSKGKDTDSIDLLIDSLWDDTTDKTVSLPMGKEPKLYSYSRITKDDLKRIKLQACEIEKSMV